MVKRQFGLDFSFIPFSCKSRAYFSHSEQLNIQIISIAIHEMKDKKNNDKQMEQEYLRFYMHRIQ